MISVAETMLSLLSLFRFLLSLLNLLSWLHMSGYDHTYDQFSPPECERKWPDTRLKYTGSLDATWVTSREPPTWSACVRNKPYCISHKNAGVYLSQERMGEATMCCMNWPQKWHAITSVAFRQTQTSLMYCEGDLQGCECENEHRWGPIHL